MSEWISLKEVMPDDRQKVLVTDGKLRQLTTVELILHTNGNGDKVKNCGFFRADKYIN